jgi:6,7-dimethyl-8-ribityllumazine synthase
MSLENMSKNFSKANKPIRLAIITSSYWSEISQGLLKHCLETLKEKGIEEKQIEVFEVPGALEIPLLAKKLAKKKKYEAIIAFGAVLKGKTFHFEQVAQECVRGCQRVAYDYEIPVVFEVLCVYEKRAALKRVIKKGKEGALTALKMIGLLKRI